MPERSRISPLEVVASALGLVLTAGMLAFIAWEALTRPGDVPPAVTVEPTQVRQAAGIWIVGFQAINHAPTTAQDVEIEGTLSQDGSEVETARATLDFVPGGSSVRGGLFFGSDPSRYDLELRALGYAEP
jgi:uncharacterized protein (TIGR02588 family)